MESSVRIALLLATLLSGCSTKPREFRAQLATSTKDTNVFDRDMRNCQVLVRKGVRGNFANSAAQVGLGAAGGIAAGALASSAATGFSSTIAAGSYTMTFAGPLIGFGVSRAIRSGREKKYKAALTNCLAEFGYDVTGWARQKRLSKETRAAALADMQRVATGVPKPE